MKKYMWLSFADITGFLGVAIVEADNLNEAIMKAWDLEINPGGEVLGVPYENPPEGMINRLLSREEAMSIGGYSTKKGN